MSNRFADSAVQLAGLAARLLGWTPDTFWRATPAELAISLPPGTSAPLTPTRTQINALMERDNDRSDRYPAG